jgi:hypothetical protein
MLLATTLMLLVFRSPSAILYVMWIIRAKMFINEKPPFRLRKFHSIANLCATLNAATTFIIFVIYGMKFRTEFMRIYCGVLTKLKSKSTIRREQQQQQNQQQQMKEFLPNNETIQERKKKLNLPLTDKSNGHLRIELLKDNSSSAATSVTTASNASFTPRKSFIERQRNRPSFDEEYDFMMRHNNNNSRQNQVTIGEDECNDNHNDVKTVSLRGSYFDWFKNFIGFRQ